MIIKSKGNTDKKAWIHPSRRRVNQVLNGETVDKSFGWTGEPKAKREVGERWVDSDGKEWEQQDGFKVSVTKYDEARQYLQSLTECKNTECKTLKITTNHLPYIKKTGYCINCLVEKEEKIRVAGLWNEYERWKVGLNQLDFCKDLLAQFIQARRDIENQPTFIQEDGTIEKWHYDGNVEELKENLEKDIVEVTEAIDNLTIETNKHFEQIKEVYNEIFES